MPATPTYVALAEVTLAASATSVTLPIPSGYRDIVFIANFGSTYGSTDYLLAYLNGDTTSGNYSDVWMRGISTSAGSSTGSGSIFESGFGCDGTSTKTSFVMNIMDYSATDKHKTILTRYNESVSAVWAAASRWASTSVVTSINLDLVYASFRTGSTFNIYGIEA